MFLSQRTYKMASCIKQYGIWRVSGFMIIGQLSDKNLSYWTAMIDEVMLVLGRCATFLLTMEKG